MKMFNNQRASRGLTRITTMEPSPSCHSEVAPFCHSEGAPFCHSEGAPFCHSEVAPFCHSEVAPFCHSEVAHFCHSEGAQRPKNLNVAQGKLPEKEALEILRGVYPEEIYRRRAQNDICASAKHSHPSEGGTK